MEEIQPIDITLENKLIQAESSIYPVILKYGAIGSAILVLVSILQFFVVTRQTFNGVVFYVLTSGFRFLAYIGVMTFAIWGYKETNDGYATLGKAFAVTFLTGLLMAFVSMIFLLIMMFGFEVTAFGMGDFDRLQENMGGKAAPFLLMLFSSLSSLFFGSMVGAVLALIISAITKKERPMGFNKN